MLNLNFSEYILIETTTENYARDGCMKILDHLLEDLTLSFLGGETVE